MERFYTIRELMEILQLSYTTVYGMCANGTLSSVKIGGSIRNTARESKKIHPGKHEGRSKKWMTWKSSWAAYILPKRSQPC
ncbi:helix-turn-helix domain-containing protein [Brevibacillus borstelensis]|uniref:helix-turn-helix domain-containing protein n=1 Tax=Brevibacillus borstelensis TaxID=45462 RepID=UPI003D1F3E42